MFNLCKHFQSSTPMSKVKVKNAIMGIFKHHNIGIFVMIHFKRAFLEKHSKCIIYAPLNDAMNKVMQKIFLKLFF